MQTEDWIFRISNGAVAEKSNASCTVQIKPCRSIPSIIARRWFFGKRSSTWQNRNLVQCWGYSAEKIKTFCNLDAALAKHNSSCFSQRRARSLSFSLIDRYNHKVLQKFGLHDTHKSAASSRRLISAHCKRSLSRMFPSLTAWIEFSYR